VILGSRVGYTSARDRGHYTGGQQGFYGRGTLYSCQHICSLGDSQVVVVDSNHY
jgi:hypothetical protein